MESRLEELSRTYRNESKYEAVIGFPKEKAELTKPHYPTGASVLDVVIWNNYGTEDIPARPFLEQSTPEIKKVFAAKAAKYQKMVNAGQLDPRLFLLQIAKEGEKIVRQRIIDLKEPPNAPRTIKKKGFDDPLIETGFMRDSVTSVIRTKQSGTQSGKAEGGVVV
jgi:hypothetical protein